jgi:hypothetical protein
MSLVTPVRILGAELDDRSVRTGTLALLFRVLPSLNPNNLREDCMDSSTFGRRPARIGLITDPVER